jgi:hypothetical protein
VSPETINTGTLPCQASCSASGTIFRSSRRPLEVKRRHPALVAQLDRASDYGSEGWGFESLRARGLDEVLVEDLHNLLMRHHPDTRPL